MKQGSVEGGRTRHHGAVVVDPSPFHGESQFSERQVVVASGGQGHAEAAVDERDVPVTLDQLTIAAQGVTDATCSSCVIGDGDAGQQVERRRIWQRPREPGPENASDASGPLAPGQARSAWQGS